MTALGPDRVVRDVDVLAQVQRDELAVKRPRREDAKLAPVLFDVVVILRLFVRFVAVLLALGFVPILIFVLALVRPLFIILVALVFGLVAPCEFLGRLSQIQTSTRYTSASIPGLASRILRTEPVSL
jgi:hypothetical protein